jgi:chromosome segregation ATPase
MTEEYTNQEDGYDYYFNNALKVNNKQGKYINNIDPGAVRSRPGRIPLSKITVEDEEKIPEKPKDILEKPNDKHYEKSLKELDEKLKKHFDSIKNLKEQIKAEKYGNTPEREKLLKEKADLKPKADELSKEIQKLDKELAKPEAERKTLRSQKDLLQKEVDFTDIKQIDAEIKSIQNKLGFSSLNMSEEKKLIDRKNKLDIQKPKVAKLSEIKSKLNEISSSNKSGFDKLKVLRESRKIISEQLKKIFTRLDELYTTAVSNDPNIKNLRLQIESIDTDIEKLKQERTAISKEWDDKWYKYEGQQKELEYINNALNKISELKKKAEKDKKRREKMEAKAGKQQQEEAEAENDNEPEEVAKFGYEIATCEWLKKYFTSLTADKTQKVSEVKTVVQINEDSKLVNLVKNEKEHELGLSDAVVAKKKGKVPKVSKRDQKIESTNILTLDLSVINKIKDVKLTVPVFKNDVADFLEKLEKAHQEFVVESEKVEEPKVAEKTNAGTEGN